MLYKYNWRKEIVKKFSFIIVFALICLNCFISVNAAEINNPPTVSAGYDHTVAVTATGELYAWGHNQYGQIGDGTTTSRYTPVKIMSDVKTAVAGSSYTLAIKNDGTLWAWGNNAWGNFGNGTKSQTNKTPIKITDNVEKVCVGDNTTFIIKTDKTLWGCGWNNDFKLGSGYGMLDECELSFIKILDNVSDVFIPEMLAAGFALKTDGTLYAWGTDHILESLDPPAEVPDIRQWIDYSVWYPIRIDTNIAECEFVDDVLHCLKNNGTYTYYATETFNYSTFYVNQSRYESKNSKKLVYPTESISISIGNYTLYTKNGITNLYGNGALYVSAIGDDVVSKNSNKLLFNNFYYAEFSKNPDVQGVFVITRDGNLWAWGGNSYGNIGAGTNSSYDKPTKIMNLGSVTITPNVVVNGERIIFPDQKAILKDGRTLVPARGVFEAMGAKVDWDGNTQTVTVSNASRKVKIIIGKNYITVDGKTKQIDVPAQLINGRTMIPVRAVAEAFDCKVGWDGSTDTATINN